MGKIKKLLSDKINFFDVTFTFLSLMSFLKWVLALIITIILVPRFEPYISNYVNNFVVPS